MLSVGSGGRGRSKGQQVYYSHGQMSNRNNKHASTIYCDVNGPRRSGGSRSSREDSPCSSDAPLTSPRNMAHNRRGNFCNTAMSHTQRNVPNNQLPQFTDYHRDMIKFLKSSWSQTLGDLEESEVAKDNNVLVYTPNRRPSDFQPINLDEMLSETVLRETGIDPNLVKPKP